MMVSAPGVSLRIFSAMTAFSETVAFLRRLASCASFLRRWRLRRSSFLRSQIDTRRLLAISLVYKGQPSAAKCRSSLASLRVHPGRPAGIPRLPLIQHAYPAYTGPSPYRQRDAVVERAGEPPELDGVARAPRQMNRSQ